MQLENNNIKVLKIFFNFLQKNQGKFLKNLEKYFRKFSKFLQNLEKIFLKKIKNSETSTVELF